jgi:hypothetical protein
VHLQGTWVESSELLFSLTVYFNHQVLVL